MLKVSFPNYKAISMLKIASFLLFIFINATAHAEELSITAPSYQVPNSEAGVLRPTQGMSMVDVEQQFGSPEKKFAAVGEPPISRWQYADFMVYFEYSHVIHSVVSRNE
jgi:hypothetical protein